MSIGEKNPHNSKQKTTEKIGMLQGVGSMNNMKEERGERCEVCD